MTRAMSLSDGYTAYLANANKPILSPLAEALVVHVKKLSEVVHESAVSCRQGTRKIEDLLIILDKLEKYPSGNQP